MGLHSIDDDDVEHEALLNEMALHSQADLEAPATKLERPSPPSPPFSGRRGRRHHKRQRCATYFRRHCCLFSSLVFVALATVALLAAYKEPHVTKYVEQAKEQIGKGAAGLGSLWNKDGGGDFPIDVGHPGPTATGTAPILVNTDTLTATPTRGNSPIETRIPGVGGPGFNPFKSMGNLSPYFSSPGFGVDDARYKPLDKGCKVVQVHSLHRHGSRYPTTGAPPEKFAGLLRSNPTASFTGPLSFLSGWKYPLGYELLTPLGREQLYESGVRFQMEYGRLVEEDLKKVEKTVVRTTSQTRILDSSISWLQGFFGIDWEKKVNLEVLIEDEGYNNTLASYYVCPQANAAVGRLGKSEMAKWIDTYLKDATRRLQLYVHGIKLTPSIVYAMQQLCPYETIAIGYSQFCGLFRKEEWEGFEYALDLEFHNSYGFGSPVGKAQGIGWVNEFMARLTGEGFKRETLTSENATLDEDPKYFPLDQSMYIDFSHDSIITNVIAALNLTQFSAPLPVTGPDPSRAFVTSHIAPFGARLTFEVISCDGGLSETKTEEEGKKLVRLLLNDAIVPLSQLEACPSRKNGMCALDDFVRSQKDRNEGAKFEEACFGSYGVDDLHLPIKSGAL